MLILQYYGYVLIVCVANSSYKPFLLARVTNTKSRAYVGAFVMQARDANGMALNADDLREVDTVILDYLGEGRVTPAYCRDRILDESVRDEITSTYCGQRLQRLEEHDHVQNLYDTGLYELVTDPRGGEHGDG